jgi:hypothetical protein
VALIERLMGTDSRPKIPVHGFQAVAAEWARGQITGTQANTAITALSGLGLDAGETTEAQALVNTVPTGSTTAQQAARALRLLEIDQVLLLVDSRVAPYDNAATVRTRLGLT